ncbi:protein DOS2-like [Humulus lupulus]|uniref:protein DOS2-like n=1 Tax=Humulus lupulus TaxID=3486 RepID=UPI002B406EAD|nr:protein DOS2-like [Humulus lupulus]
MDFFKSVFADEPTSSSEPSSDPDDDPQYPHQSDADDSNDTNTAWSFGGLIKTLATKSESVIHNYRRDLEEFGSELKKETSVIREVASRAVKDLPTSLEVGASVAQESLESVGQAIDDIGTTVWKSTAEIITHGRDTLLAADADDDADADADGDPDYALDNTQHRRSLDSKPYSRLEAQVRSIQSNIGTYLEEPEDLESYEEWKLGLLFDEKREEIDNLINENDEIGVIYRTIVPEKIESEIFWLRYFYRVHKLKEIDDARVKLVKRAISGEEEDLSWDFDDDDEEEGEQKGNSSVEIADKGKDKTISSTATTTTATGTSTSGSDNGDNSKEGSKYDEKVGVELVSESKTSDQSSDSCKDSDVSIVSKPEEEEDIGWDEIEDIRSNDEFKSMDSVGGSSSRVDLHKRLSNAAEEDEDLSWDVEDDEDDEPSKS